MGRHTLCFNKLTEFQTLTRKDNPYPTVLNIAKAIGYVNKKRLSRLRSTQENKNIADVLLFQAHERHYQGGRD